MLTTVATAEFVAVNKRKNQNMKTYRMILTIAVTAVVATFNPKGNAAEALHSPRGRENQIRTVRGVTEDRLDRLNQFKHRSDSILHTRVKGVSEDRDLVREAREVTVSPRAAEAFPWLVNRSACRCDVTATVAACPTRS
jgi:hypothetical protein